MDDDFLHYQNTVMILQVTRTTGQGVLKITSSNGTELFQFWSPIYIKRRNRFSHYNKSRSNLQTDIGKNQHFHEEKELLFYLRLHPRQTNLLLKDPEKMQTFYEQLPDIIRNINTNILIIIRGDFNAKTKICNRDPSQNKIIGKYVKSNINENGEKLIELSNLHNL